MCSLLSEVWLVSQHEGILLSLIIKSIKVTSMLERLDSVCALVTGRGYTVADFIITPVWSDCWVMCTLRTQTNQSRRGKYYSSVRAKLSVLSWMWLSVVLFTMSDTPPRKTNLFCSSYDCHEIKVSHEHPQEPVPSNAHTYVKCCTGDKVFGPGVLGMAYVNILSWTEYIWEYQSM